MDAGANPNARVVVGYRAKYGHSPLHTAARLNPNPGIIDALVLAGTLPNSKSAYKWVKT